MEDQSRGSVDPSGKMRLERGFGHGKGIYWLLRHVVLGPVVTKIFRPIVEGTEHVRSGGGHPGQQPPVVRRLVLLAARWIVG